MNTRFVVAFDIDMTLIDMFGRPIHETLDLLRAFVRVGADVVVWSGGGLPYAQDRVRRLGLDGLVRVEAKGSGSAGMVDLAIDDQEVALGTVNFRVGQE